MKNKNNNLLRNFTVTGHSGCESTPANSVESIKKAYEVGCDITEIDIRFTADGTPVLSHDAGNNKAVTLDEAFAAAEHLGHMLINLDIKETSHLANIIPIAEKYSMSKRVFCTGIFAADTEKVKQQLPGYTYYLNIKIRPAVFQTKAYLDNLCRIIKDNGAVGINCNHRRVTKKMTEYLHSKNLLVSLWTVDKKKDMTRVISLGPDNITTRHPSEIIKML